MVPSTDATARNVNRLMAKRIELNTSMAWRHPLARGGVRGAAGAAMAGVAMVEGVAGVAFTVTADTELQQIQSDARQECKKGGAKPPV